jgi:predicted transcriptional regulator
MFMDINLLASEEKTILKIVNSIHDEFTLQQIHEKTQIETGEAEKILEKLIGKGAVKKEADVYAFKYAISHDGKRIIDLWEQEQIRLRYEICP